MKFGAGLWMFGQFVDRYATDAYGPEVSTLEAIERAGAVGELEALDVNYPFSHPDITVEEVDRTQREAGLRAATITPHLYMREFVRGALNPRSGRPQACAGDLRGGRRRRPAPRRADGQALARPGRLRLPLPGRLPRAVEARGRRRAHRRRDGRARPRRDRVQDQGAAHAPELVDGGTPLLGIAQTGRDDVGIVMDLGHSLFAKEAPADALSLVHEHGRLYTIEVNDNWREWDDDLAVGSIHLIETLEFFLEVRKIGWDEPIFLDQFPFREDPVEAARTSTTRSAPSTRHSTASTSTRSGTPSRAGRPRRPARPDRAARTHYGGATR